MASVTVDLNAKTIVLSECKSGTLSTVATGTLVNDFDASKLHTVRVSSRDGKVDVVFDNMTKIDDASLNTSAGKIGYKGLSESAAVGYTAYSNVAMGMSDQREAKQALGTIGASDYLYENTYNVPVKLGDESGISTIEDGGSLNGVKSLTLGAQNDYASYLVNFKESGSTDWNSSIRAEDGGKKRHKVDDGTVTVLRSLRYRRTKRTLKRSSERLRRRRAFGFCVWKTRERKRSILLVSALWKRAT